ncbi:MAG: efflux RND transporter periplasmic adaptor subunit [Candidatus Omnitrophica bacterium]|nr:efflux RND transporter periplasmic adaptor subunit [Candidatus Omnitrophota bacterium]
MINRKVFGVLILVVATVFLFSSAGCDAKGKKRAADGISVKTMKVELRDIDKTLDYVGNITGQDEAKVYPKVSGKIIEKLKEDGSEVKKGDILAYIDRDEVGFQFEKAPVESPLTGIVGRVYVDKGTSVSPDTPIALVVDMDNVEVNLDAPEKYLHLVSLGQAAEIKVDAYPEEEFAGKVSKMSPVVDLETRTAPIEIVILNSDHRLKPGMFARLRLIMESHHNVPVIMKEAIVGKEPNVYVYIVSAEGKASVAHQRKIKLGVREGPYYEVTEGLKEGETVVVMGQQRLYDGAHVKAEERAAGK